jgi:hypothetical protein
MEAYDFSAGQTLWGYNAPSGNLIVMNQSSANGGSAATLQSLGANGYVDNISRIDSTGTATNDSWSAPNLQYDLGNQFLTFSSSSSTAVDALFGAPILGNSAVWAQLGNGGTRAPTQKVKLRVGRITEAAVQDAFINGVVNPAISFWQQTGHILLDWDKTIQSYPSCVTTCSPNIEQDPIACLSRFSIRPTTT